MTQSEVKQCLVRIIQSRYPEDPVMWAEQYTPQFELPQVTLKLKDTGVPVFPLQVVEDGVLKSYYECTKILEINRYTKGISAAHGENEIAGQENTAADELIGLTLYLQSERVTDVFVNYNLSVLQRGAVRDLTALENGTRYKYRAMQEYTVKYHLEYVEGSEEPGSLGWFEKIETEERYE